MTELLIRRRCAAGLAALGCLLAGCSSSATSANKTGTGSSSSPAATASSTSSAPSSGSSSSGTSDAASLLIDASDIPVAGFTKSAPQAVAGSGAAAAYTSSDGTRVIGDTVVVLPDTNAAKIAYEAAKNTASKTIEGATSADAQVGDGGTGYVGTTGGGTKASVLVVFTQGKAFVTMEFDSPKGDTVPADVVKQVAQAQAAKIKASLPA